MLTQNSEKKSETWDKKGAVTFYLYIPWGINKFSYASNKTFYIYIIAKQFFFLQNHDKIWFIFSITPSF